MGDAIVGRAPIDAIAATEGSHVSTAKATCIRQRMSASACKRVVGAVRDCAPWERCLPTTTFGYARYCATAAAPAASLADAFRLRETAATLVLSASPDLLCRNIMCEKVGGPCICRMALSLSRMTALRNLELSDNNLVALPDTVWGYPATPDAAGAQVLALERLVLRNNRFQHFPPSAGLGRAADSLQELDLRWNLLASADAFESWLPRMRGLRKLLIGGNPICQRAEDIQRVRDMLSVATASGSGRAGTGERHAQTPAALDLSVDAAASRTEPTIA